MKKYLLLSNQAIHQHLYHLTILLPNILSLLQQCPLLNVSLIFLINPNRQFCIYQFLNKEYFLALCLDELFYLNEGNLNLDKYLSAHE